VYTDFNSAFSVAAEFGDSSKQVGTREESYWIARMLASTPAIVGFEGKGRSCKPLPKN
jgi:hypothetical protein